VTIDGWALACLVAMAVALVAIALGQVILALAAVRMGRETVKAVNELRGDLKPVLETVQHVTENVQRVTENASKVSALAVIQMERLDEVMASAAQRLDETLNVVQHSVVGPLRQGAAVMTGVRAAFEHLVKGFNRPRHSREDEDALFVG